MIYVSAPYGLRAFWRYLQPSLLACISLLMLAGDMSHATTQSWSGPQRLGREKEFWRVVMSDFYGRYDAGRKCWMSKYKGVFQCMRPHKLDIIDTKSGRLLYAVVGGHRFDEKGGRVECHGCAGALGLLVFSERAAKLTLVARNSLYEDFGSWGSIPDPDNFSIREIGPGKKGWLIRSGYLGGGRQTGWISVFAVIGDGVSPIGTLPETYSDSGACDKDCSTYSFDVVLDAFSAEKPFYPFVLRASGVRKGQSYSETYRIELISRL
jgi:hypothetical protein